MKFRIDLYLLSLVILLGLGCATRTAYTPANQKWLSAAQHMVLVNHDLLVSTKDPTRAKLFIKWAEDRGYLVRTYNYEPTMGPVQGYREGMTFIQLRARNGLELEISR